VKKHNFDKARIEALLDRIASTERDHQQSGQQDRHILELQEANDRIYGDELRTETAQLLQEEAMAELELSAAKARLRERLAQEAHRNETER